MIAQTDIAAPSEVFATPERSFWQDARQRFFRNRMAVFGLVLLGGLILLAVIGPIVARGDYTTPRSGLELKRPLDHRWIFGTDDLGRDLFKRVIRGLGISLRLAAAVTFVVTMLGMVLGGLAGYLGGIVDSIISRAIDALYAIPYIIIGIALITTLRTKGIFGWKPSFFLIVMITLSTVGWISTARLFRAAVLQVRSQDFIEAARSTGAGTLRVILSHVVPNALPPVIVSIAFTIAGTILSESIYSFLGIGFIEPTPALGVMISGSRSNYQNAPHLLMVPATVLILLTLAIVFVGDGLRDALDPKLRGSN